MRRAVGAAAVGVVLAVSAPAPARAAPSVVCRPTDARLTELSGLGVGISSPGVLYVHNDSGDSARFFALDGRTCAVLGEYTVPGARNVDWEDLAVARDARGVPSVWLADIGDNDRARDEVRLYRVDEPAVDRSGRDSQHLTAAAQTWRLRYPDGPHDAESLAVFPGGHAYVVTKELLGDSRVYAVPARPSGGVQTLVPVAQVQFRLTATRGGPNPVGRLTATGAAVSADGGVLAVRTYTDVYLWSVAGGDVAAALSRPPVLVPAPGQRQGEGVALDGRRLLLDSEGVGQPVEELPLPALAPAPPSSPAARPPGRTADHAVASRPGGRSRALAGAGIGAAVAVGVAAAALLLRRRRAH